MHVLLRPVWLTFERSYIQAESNGDYTIHLDPAVAKELTTLLAANQSGTDKTPEPPSRRDAKRQAGGPVFLPVNIPTTQRPQILQCMRVIAKAVNGPGPAQRLRRIQELAPRNARVTARPLARYQVS